jgi:hypothetical protein
MEEIAGWTAPIATAIAAMMTAANLGARVTGWGFVVFTVASISWSLVAVGSGQQNLLWTNVFLMLVNGAGVWRWLGRQARYEEGGEAAMQRSAVTHVPTLLSVGSLAGAKLSGRDGDPLGVVVDAMMRCADAQLAYIVVSEGGVGGVGERLHALHPDDVQFSHEGLTCDLRPEELAHLPVLQQGAWPATLDRRTRAC